MILSLSPRRSHGERLVRCRRVTGVLVSDGNHILGAMCLLTMDSLKYDLYTRL